MDESRVQRHVLFSELASAKRSKDWPNQRYNDQIKAAMKATGIKIKSFERTKDSFNRREKEDAKIQERK